MLSNFAKSSLHIRRCGDVAEVVLGIDPSCAAQEEATNYPNKVRLGTLDYPTYHKESIRDDKCFQVQLPESVSAKNQAMTLPANNNAPPDEESKAFGDKDESSNKVAFSSASLGASDDSTMSSPKRSYDESEGFAFTPLSDNMEEEPVMPSKKSRGAKRRRSTELHYLSERRRREKINKKMRALQDLLPNCTKVDKASLLEEAIEYLKTLQFQLQTMSMGCYLPWMMSMGRMPPQFPQMGSLPPPQFLTTTPMLQGLSMSGPQQTPFFNPMFVMPPPSSATPSVPVNLPFQQLGDSLLSQSNSKNLYN